MTRLMALEPTLTTGKTKELLDSVLAGNGKLSNMIRTLANSPVALEGYLAFSGALAKGKLDPKLREGLALVVAEANQSDYCLSSHTEAGQAVGLSRTDSADARDGNATDAKFRAALVFARKLIDKRGEVQSGDVAGLKAIGFLEGEISEIVANVALSVFTNYFNHAAGTEIDFPRVTAHAPR